MSAEDDYVLEHFKETTRHTGERYQVHLPWRLENMRLSSNRKVAENRFQYLMRKFRANGNLYGRYSEVINDYLEKKIIEPVKIELTENPLYYLPHHAIIKEERATTKVRVGFDASSHDKDGMSLNKCLYTGPNLNPELLSVLLKFRENRIAVTGRY